MAVSYLQSVPLNLHPSRDREISRPRIRYQSMHEIRGRCWGKSNVHSYHLDYNQVFFFIFEECPDKRNVTLGSVEHEKLELLPWSRSSKLLGVET